MKRIITALLIVLLEALAGAQTQSLKSAFVALERSSPFIQWNINSAKEGDVDCDGKPDTVMLGSKKNGVAVGIVWGSPAKKPEVLLFPIGSDAPDAFCSGPSSIHLSPIECQAETGPLPGCKMVQGCKEFSVTDDECDPFNFYWNSSRKALGWWRN